MKQVPPKTMTSSVFFHHQITNADRDGHETVMKFPAGIRFRPTDEELIVHYLKKKMRNEPIVFDKIECVNVYRFNPWDLCERYDNFGDGEWYFFTPRERKYRNGSRPSREAGIGCWKAIGADKPIRNGENEIIGAKRSLVFQTNAAAGKVIKTDWHMHEYTTTDPDHKLTTDRSSARHHDDMLLDGCVLCRIYEIRRHRAPIEERPPAAKRLKTSGEVDQPRGIVGLAPDIPPPQPPYDHPIILPPVDENTTNNRELAVVVGDQYYDYNMIQGGHQQPLPPCEFDRLPACVAQPLAAHPVTAVGDEGLSRITPNHDDNFNDQFDLEVDFSDPYLEEVLSWIV